MASLKSLKLRIRSVKNTQQITKAMKMVAAAKLRRAQDNAISARSYSENLKRITERVAAGLAENESAPPMLRGRADSDIRVELVVFTSDRGLCGSFNSSVIRAVRARIPELEKEGFSVSLSLVGKKGYDVLKRQYSDRVRKVYSGMGKRLTYRTAEEEIGADLVANFDEGAFDICYLVYNTFRSAMSQDLTWRQVIPAPLPEEDPQEEEEQGGLTFEPNEEEFLQSLAPRALAVQIFQAMMESEASEHGSRMTAMDSAVKNASEMIRKLTITYNRTRQANITRELMEIIGGAEALKG